MKNLKLTILIFIIALAAFLRFNKLDKVPPSLNWDEVAASYNAYTIAHWGADEYGNKFPITFRSFGDDKHPVHIYLTAPIVGIFDLSDYSARASSALIGTLTVLAIYILVKKLTHSEMAGLFSALFLGLSPYHLQYSRGLWEANFALSFLIIGLAAFYTGVKKQNWLVPLAFFCFGLSFFSYHSAKVVVPPVALFLILSNLKNIFKNKKVVISIIIVGLLFAGLILKDERILGFARVNQNKFSQEDIQKYGGKLQIYWRNYKEYYSYSYLFEKGDQNPRGSVKVVGEFYKIDMVLLPIGFIALLLKKKWQAAILLFLWLVLSPIPGAITQMTPGSTRGIFMLGPIIILSGIGASSLITIFKNNWLKIIAGLIITAALIYESQNYLRYYYTKYAKADAIEWQYGMKQIVEYLIENPDYAQVFMDKIRQQPYIFFLNYFRVPLPELLTTVRYDQSQSKSYNTVLSFDKYQFGGNWNIIESYPTYGILYIMTPSYYSGLRYINDFEVKKLIKYPNGNDAFYIVEGYK